MSSRTVSDYAFLFRVHPIPSKLASEPIKTRDNVLFVLVALDGCCKHYPLSPGQKRHGRTDGSRRLRGLTPAHHDSTTQAAKRTGCRYNHRAPRGEHQFFYEINR